MNLIPYKLFEIIITKPKLGEQKRMLIRRRIGIELFFSGLQETEQFSFES